MQRAGKGTETTKIDDGDKKNKRSGNEYETGNKKKGQAKVRRNKITDKRNKIKTKVKT
jgi:hypothetical protein